MWRLAIAAVLPHLAVFSFPAAEQEEKPGAEKSVESTAFRTDAGEDESLPWFQLKEGEFPPEGSSHYISGELIDVDHVERVFVLRADRTDKQNRSHFDLPLRAEMLPYGAIYYNGALAALEDIPLGTHLHGRFYMKDPEAESIAIEAFQGRVTPEADFSRCFELEDDFSHYQRKGQIWRIDRVDLGEKKLSATLLEGGKDVGEAQEFDLLESVKVWKGRAIEEPEGIEVGQLVQFNITWATLYGPGRIREIWLDESSRNMASSHQKMKHLEHVRQRGLPGWIDAVDNGQRVVTITFFNNVDAVLFDEIVKGQHAGIAVATRSLATYDPVNDRKRGPVLEKLDVETGLGSSGVQVQIKPDLLLEGFRPAKIVRVYPGSWPVIALPKEEQYFGR